MVNKGISSADTALSLYYSGVCVFLLYVAWRLTLKGSGLGKGRGIGKQATFKRWFRTGAIDVCLVFNVPVVFSSTYFPFLFVKLS
jgi:hypothetical protein